jgi:pyridoxal phosphate enzyme (YggS family)
MNKIAERTGNIRGLIDKACSQANRDPQSVTLIAVSKTKPAESIVQAAEAGLTDIGENYVQEAIEKFDQLKNLGVTWHFIGPLQSNKTRQIAERFDWVQTVDRLKIARRLSEQRPDELPPLNVLIQINISDDPNKSGIPLAELPLLAQQIRALPRIQLRGLMAIPAVELSPEQQQQQFQLLKQAQLALQQQDPQCDTLSLGMSGDFAEAIAAGSTMVRVGSALFGQRDYSATGQQHQGQ